jgi:hypothetical protein
MFSLETYGGCGTVARTRGAERAPPPRRSSSTTIMIAVVAIVREPAKIPVVMVAVVITDLMMPIFVGLCGSLQSSECKHTDGGRGGQGEDCPAHGEKLLLDEGPDAIFTTVYMVPFRRTETHLVGYKLDTCLGVNVR